MLTFDDSFTVDSIEEGSLGCVIWASEPKFSRVRFHLRHQILMDVLHGESRPSSKKYRALREIQATNRKSVSASTCPRSV